MRRSEAVHSTRKSAGDARIACLCGAIVLAAFLIVNPFAEMPFDDDWSYAFTARQLLATGRLTYNGWSAPVIVSQAYWGAMFCKLFGFSFTVLRFSTLPFAIGCVVLCYLLARRADLSPRASAFAAMTLGLSPLFLPLATSFMTDVPGLFFILLSLYCLVIAGAKSRGGFAVLAVAVVAGILGGMSRQVVWAVPLCLLPYVALIRRSHRWFVIGCITGWTLVVADAMATLIWFQHQSDIVVEPAIRDWLAVGFTHPIYPLAMGLFLYLTTVLLALPAGIPFIYAELKRLRRDRIRWFGYAVIVAVIAAIIARPGFAIEPWLNDILTITGVMGGNELHGARPLSQPMSIRIILSAATILISSLLLIRFNLSAVIEQARRALNPDPRRCALTMMAIFAAAYVALLVPRMCQTLLFDRYALPLLPLLAIGLLAVLPRPQPRWIPLLACGALAIYACYALASTQDVLAMARARAAAVSRLEAAGVPATAITAGFEYDYWTQLTTAGWINRPEIANPSHRFDPNLGPCPAIRPVYRLETQPDGDTEPTGFGAVDYTSWLPPFRRQVRIDRFRERP